MRADDVTATHELERYLGDWLERDGPQDVPDRVVEAAIDRAARTSRVRPWPRAATRVLDLAQTLSPTGPAALERRMRWAGGSVTWVLGLALLVGGLLTVGSIMATLPPATLTNGPLAYDSGGDIWVIDPVGSGIPRNLTSTPAASESGPVWSPDGRRLAYWATTAAGSEIHVVDPYGNLDRTLTAPKGLVLPPDAAIFGWSPDSRSLVAPARGSITDDGLTRVGVEQVILYDIASRAGHAIAPELEAVSFGWSPDGRWIGLQGADGRLYVISPDGGQPIALAGPVPSSDSVDRLGSSIGLPTFVGSDDVAFTADMSAIATGVIPDRRDGDILIARPAEAIASLVEGPTNDVTPQLSPDGLALAFGRSDAATALAALAGPWEPDASSRSADLYLVGFGDGKDALPQPVRIAEDVWPDAAWSPDGRLIATKSDDWRDLVVVELARHEAERRLTVTADDAWIGSFSWRPIPP